MPVKQPATMDRPLPSMAAYSVALTFGDLTPASAGQFGTRRDGVACAGSAPAAPARVGSATLGAGGTERPGARACVLRNT